MSSNWCVGCGAKMSETVYLGLKSLHVIAVISWMAGLLYLPRLYVYHTEKKQENSIHALLMVMERRLYHFIMTPALIVTWASGLVMMVSAGWMVAGWMHLKLFFVLAMTGFHFYLGILRKRFVAQQIEQSARFFRMINEIPTLLMIGIVILVIYKAF
jgi:putative membrane protein